jgi:hypothetical protein
MAPILNDLQIFAEGFYSSAWRFRDILANHLKLPQFNPAGVRNVRYQLIDHVQASNPQFFFGTALGFGPVIERYDAELRERRVIDDGLYVNAGEFLRELTGLLLRRGLDPER